MTTIQTDKNGLKKTPMYDIYVDRGARITDFGGWALPVQITGIQEEHNAVRNGVGLFDASHMGEILISGEKALEWFNGLITNDLTNMKDGQALYTAVVKEDGGTLDDLIFYKRNDEYLMLTPNASNTEKIWNWLVEHNHDDVTLEDRTAEYGLIAIQGPDAQELLSRVTDTDLDSIKYYHYLPDQTVGGVENVQVSRTGYTGEDGFELYIPWDKTAELWELLVEKGKDLNVTECALGARDTLRLEAGLVLYGNELSEDINPIEGGVAFAVKTGDKKEADYIGKEALAAYRAGDKKRISRGFELEGTGIARPGMEVTLEDGTVIGTVTSGTKSPTFDKAIGFMLIDRDAAKLGDTVYIKVRKKQVPATLVKKDWLNRK